MGDTAGDSNKPKEGPAGRELSERQVRRQELAATLRRVRGERFGEDGAPVVARRLGIPARTWRNYEDGVTIPGEILLAFMEVAGVDVPRLIGRGDGQAGANRSPHSRDTAAAIPPRPDL